MPYLKPSPRGEGVAVRRRMRGVTCFRLLSFVILSGGAFLAELPLTAASAACSSQSEVMRGSRLTVSLFLPQKAAFPKLPRFHLRESLPDCRSKASSASKVASVCESIEVRLNFSRCSPPYEKNPTARRRIQLFCPISVL